MFALFESIINPLADGHDQRPPDRITAFIWHYVRQAWKALAALLLVSGIGALVEVSLFDFIGRIVDLLKDTAPDRLFADYGVTLLLMAAVTVLLRPAIHLLHLLLVHQTVEPSLTNLIRWQTHRYMLRQSLGFFQNDFAGRLANRIIQTGPALREAVVNLIDGIWYVTIYTTSALVLFAEADVRLTVPLVLWIAAYVAVLWHFVPKVKHHATVMSEARSALTGRIVDSFTVMMLV